MTRVILPAGANKGGVGKTYVTQHCAALAALEGKKVLVVDLDNNHGITENLVKSAYPDYGLQDDDELFDEFIAGFTNEYLSAKDIMGATNLDMPVLSFPVPPVDENDEDASISLILGTADSELDETGEPRVINAAISNLRTSLNALNEQHGFDYIFLDIGPNVTSSFQASFMAATDVVIITKPDQQGQGNLRHNVKGVLETSANRDEEGHPLAYHGILINNWDKRSRIPQKMAKAIRAKYDNIFDTVLYTRETIIACPSFGFLWEFDGDSAVAGTKEIMAFWGELSGRMSQHDISMPPPFDLLSPEGEPVKKPREKKLRPPHPPHIAH